MGSQNNVIWRGNKKQKANKNKKLKYKKNKWKKKKQKKFENSKIQSGAALEHYRDVFFYRTKKYINGMQFW